MVFISVGYPVGFDGVSNYIETQNDYIEIPYKDFLLWKDVHRIEELSDEDLIKCAELHDKGLLIYAETDKEIFPLIQDLTILRQGMGWSIPTEDVYAITFKRGGVNPPIDIDYNAKVLPNSVMYHIWHFADGKLSLKEIYNSLVDLGVLSESDDTVFDFVANLSLLADCQLVFYR